MVETRKNGQSVFSNVTGDLLFVSQCIDGKLTRTPLFDSSLQNYLWQYDNTGLKLLQLGFYQVPATIDGSGCSCYTTSGQSSLERGFGRKRRPLRAARRC